MQNTVSLSDALIEEAETGTKKKFEQCRMYEEEYPEVDQLVMVRVNRISTIGAFVSLLEYGNKEGIILLSELSRRRMRSVNKHIRVGKQEVLQVLRVDKEKGLSLSTFSINGGEGELGGSSHHALPACPPLPRCFLTVFFKKTQRNKTKTTPHFTKMMKNTKQGYIDLSKKNLKEEDIAECTQKFMKSKTVHSIMAHVADTQEVPEGAAPKTMEELYAQLGWPLYRKYGHAYDAFKKAARCIPIPISISIPIPFLLLFSSFVLLVWFAYCLILQSGSFLYSVCSGEDIFEGLEVDEILKDTLLKAIQHRLGSQPVKVQADIQVTCFSYEGIDAIKPALRAGQECSSESPIKVCS
ncbi:Eukaryotic translation initiation factor 2 subunit alpha, variant 2 [Balamuthia mandrillaris]